MYFSGVEAVLAVVVVLAHFALESGTPDGADAAAAAVDALVAGRDYLHFGDQAGPVQLFGEVDRQVVAVGGYT